MTTRLSLPTRDRGFVVSIFYATLALALLVAIHAAFRFESGVRVLYILPIWIAVRLSGKWAGLAMVGVCTCVMLWIDLTRNAGVSSTKIVSDAALRALAFVALTWVIASVEDRLRRAQDLALHDPLTGLYNRRALDNITKDMERAPIPHLGAQHARVVALIDCDGFKGLNDTHGHQAGDDVLRILARVLETETRNEDLIARIGGDEFVLVLENTGPAEAGNVLSRIERVFEANVNSAGYACSLSVGMAAAETRTTPIDDLIRTADHLMYERKSTKKLTAYLR